LPAFGERPLEQITTADIEQWRAGLCAVDGSRPRRGADDQESRSAVVPRPLTNNSENHIMVLLNGVFARACKVWNLPVNPVASVERRPTCLSGDIEVFSPEEVWALVRAAESEQDGALFLTAALLVCASAS
jgi:hypothetical protein